MSEEGLQIAVSRPDAGAITWRVTADDGTVNALLPDGSSVDVARSGELLADLAALAQVLPDITRVPPGERVEIECSATVAAVLPLWLRPDDDRFIDGSGAACSDDVEDQMSWATVSLDHCVFVNGEQWAVIWAMAEGHEGSWVAVPVRGEWYSEWFEEEYASFTFTETASRISGWDVSRCGLITPRVFAVVDKLDERETYVTVREAADPASDLRDWVWSSELASQLRDTWEVSDGEDDFIEWGLMELAKSGRSEIELSGLDDGMDTEYLGVGLTTSSRWTFTCGLPADTIRSALGVMFGRRPGGTYVRQPRALEGSPRERLEQASLLSDDELVEEGWVPAVDVDPEMGIKIFNVRVEPEADSSSVDALWPATWEPAIAPLWERLGGTVEAARAWAEGGWDYRDVLRGRRLSAYWNPTVEERLRLTAVPPVTDLDAPSDGSPSWPGDGHTIADLLEIFRDWEGW